MGKNRGNLGPDRISGLKLAYVVGSYPQVSTTFIDQEISTLRKIGAEIEVVSIRRPPNELTDGYEEVVKRVNYLLPPHFASMLKAHTLFALGCPWLYFGTLMFLMTRRHPCWRLWLRTLLHFGEGVYAAYLLRDGGWEHIHAHFVDRAATVAFCVSRLLGVQYSVTVHARNLFVEPVLIAEKLSHAAFTVTVSNFNKAYLLQQYPRMASRKIVVLHPWIELADFPPSRARSSRSRLHILSVGRLVEKKGHHYLIEACQALALQGVDFECQIVGDGPMRDQLHQQIGRLNLANRVRLLGRRRHAEVRCFLEKCDVFVLACLVAEDGDRDGMPVVLAEAMAMELPVITTELVGIRELVEPGSGLLIPPRDSASLAQAIMQIHQLDQSKRARMGKRGRAIVAKRFELQSGVRRLATLFQEACAG